MNALLQDAENRIHELGTGAEDLPQLPFSTRASFSSIIGKYLYIVNFFSQVGIHNRKYQFFLPIVK